MLLFYGTRNISNVGFVGLGNMGKPMAKNLMQKGFKVTVYDINSDVSNSLRNEGATVAKSLAELSSNNECVITMLPNNQHVLDSYSKNDGIINHVKEGTVLIDSSTVDPEVAHKLGPLAKEKGAIFLDTPVSGGVMAAQSGQLTFMVGGPEEGLKLVSKVLLAMGCNIFYCGSHGSGQVAKICNNMLLGITMAGLSEAMNLGIRLGLDPKVLTSVINSSSGRCWSSEVYNPVSGVMENVPSSRNYQGGFLTKLLIKDLNLAKNAAERSSSPIPLGELALNLYNNMTKAGHSDRDFSFIYEFIKKHRNTGF
ncbi:3-hydroxyisobutyrate dehydrogenase, mitochondrial isoform X2 [Lycorma delicatula]|uniref:3-hydroxyisobutyrate dehydrogenase, mitochondrial isoform X2 n=1 Tax=Lycorma delicatula TaxID=130591 RepID=UPI003F510FB8